MNPLHLSGFDVQIEASNKKSSKALLIRNGRREGSLGERYAFSPRQCPHDSIIIEGKSGHISLRALHWLSGNNIPIFAMGYDGSVVSSILPPAPIKADLRVAQIQAAIDNEKKFNIAHALVKAKIEKSLQVLDWLAERYDITKEVGAAKHEAIKLSEAKTVNELRTVEGRTALRYWEAFEKVIPDHLRFQGRMVNTKAMNATDPVNAALNYGYGFLKCECRMAINTVGLEPAIGFLHESADYITRESLVYDLEEPFRFLVDLTVMQVFESRLLGADDFAWDRDGGLFRIQEDGRRQLLDLLRKRFNSGVAYKGQRMKWDTVIEEKTNELARYLNGRPSTLSFEEPAPILERTDNRAVRQVILSLTQSKARERGIGKSTLHYLREKARDPRITIRDVKFMT
jgi:CRISPR-associated protein Cas1